jgi:5-methylcytosine-specific restriction endonuclease McrA
MADHAAIRGSNAYRQLCARIRRQHPPICWLCRGPIDLRLPYRDKATNRVNTMCWSLDHVQPLDTYPHLALEPSNCRPAHYRCNSARGKRPASTVRPDSPRPAPKTTREW